MIVIERINLRGIFFYVNFPKDGKSNERKSVCYKQEQWEGRQIMKYTTDGKVC